MEGAGPKHRLGGDRSLDSLLRSQLSHSYKVWRTELCRFLRNIVVAEDRETALREAGPFLEASYRIFGQWGLFTGPGGGDKEQLTLEELIEGRVIIGSPEECAEQLCALQQATDFTRLVARVQWLGMDQDIVLRTVRLLGEKVLPIVNENSK